MDISDDLLAKSAQLNAVDLIGGDRTVTITDVTKGSTEQPYNIITDVFGAARPFRPSLTVLRILGAAWGNDTSKWIGRQVTLYRDPSVTWAGAAVGGIRVKSMSNIKKSFDIVLPTSKTKYATSNVQLLPDAEPVAPLAATKQRDWLSELTLAGDDLEAVASLGKAATDAHAAAADIAAIRARYDGLKVGA